MFFAELLEGRTKNGRNGRAPQPPSHCTRVSQYFRSTPPTSVSDAGSPTSVALTGARLVRKNAYQYRYSYKLQLTSTLLLVNVQDDRIMKGRPTPNANYNLRLHCY